MAKIVVLEGNSLKAIKMLLQVFNNKLEEDLASEGQLGTVNQTSDFTPLYNE